MSYVHWEGTWTGPNSFPAQPKFSVPERKSRSSWVIYQGDCWKQTKNQLRNDYGLPKYLMIGINGAKIKCILKLNCKEESTIYFTFNP